MTAAVGTRPADDLRTTVRRLAAAQKGAAGAPAYSRFVNRPLGRLFAALAFHAGLTPNAVTAFDVDFNREVVADAGRYFRTPADVAREVVAVEADPEWVTRSGQRARELAGGYDWDSVAAGYGELARALAERRFPARRPSGRRRTTAADASPAPRPAQRPAGVVPLPAPAPAVEDLPVVRP